MPLVPANRGGEAHFSASSWAVLYYQVLFLTGQFEAAVDFLYGSGLARETKSCKRNSSVCAKNKLPQVLVKSGVMCIS